MSAGMITFTARCEDELDEMSLAAAGVLLVVDWTEVGSKSGAVTLLYMRA